MNRQQTAPINQYLQPLFDHKKLVLAVWGLVIALGVGAGLAAPVSYASTAAILVYPSSGDPTKALETDDADVDMATELRIATSQAVINLVIERLAQQGVGSDSQVLSDNITATSTKESTILDLTFVAATPELASTGANAFAQSYLAFRADLAAGNKLSAETAIDDRIALLQERLAAVQTQIAVAGIGDRVILNSEKDTIEADLAAQQLALGALSTPTIDATVIIDEAEPPQAPEGLGLVQIVVGAIAGGLVSGVVAGYVLSAYAEGRSNFAGTVGPETTVEPTGPAGRPTAHDSPSGEPVAQNSADSILANQNPADQNPGGGNPTANGSTGSSDAAEVGGQAKRVATGTAGSSEPQSVQKSAARPEPLHDRRLKTEDGRPAGDNKTGRRAMVVSDDMEPVIRYLQGLGATGSVATMVVGERQHHSAATVSLVLAEALQALGARVLIIDAGLGTPTLDDRLRLSRNPGLGEVLSGAKALKQSVHRVGGGEGLDVLTVGSAAPSTVLAASFERLLNEARLEYHSILVIGGSLLDKGIIPEIAPLTEGVIIGTDRPSGDLADPNLHSVMAKLPTPTLELLTAATVDGLAALTGTAKPGV